jgi:hypothetical protein
MFVRPRTGRKSLIVMNAPMDIMDSIDRPAEKSTDAKIEHTESRLSSPSAELAHEDENPHIHAKTITLIFVSSKPRPPSTLGNYLLT